MSEVLSRMFAACCCNEDRSLSDSQLNFQTGTDELVWQSDLQELQPSRTLLEQPADIPSEGRSVASVEREKEKERQRDNDRLQKLVNRFARKAVKGVACTYLDESTGERVATKYRIVKGREYMLIVKDERGSRHQEVSCPIGGIQDIYSIVEDGEACFPARVLSAVRPEELEQLLMVVYHNGNEAMARFCMLEDSRASLDMFLECLKVLSIYAQQPASRRQG